MPWLQLHLTVDKSSAPLIELLFQNLGALAITLGDAGDEPMLEPAPGETPLWQATRVTGLFSGEHDRDALRSAVDQALATDASRSLSLETVDERDWERAWLDLFQAMRFGRHLWIRPSGQDIDDPDGIIVDLDPGLAFGTGTHPTTALCLTWLDQHPPRGRQVIDFGSGSGILAIAALKLGAAHALAVDHDPQAVLASRDNAQRNNVDQRLQVVHSGAFTPTQADLVIANILANVLIELAPTIGALIRPGGELLMSGILREQADDVVSAYADVCQFDRPQMQDDWVLLHGRWRDQLTVDAAPLTPP